MKTKSQLKPHNTVAAAVDRRALLGYARDGLRSEIYRMSKELFTVEAELGELGKNGDGVTHKPARKAKKVLLAKGAVRTISAEHRARIAEAQKARWDAKRKEKDSAERES